MTDDPMARMKQDFISDTSDTIDKISRSLATIGPKGTPSRTQVDWLFRTVHSLKGTAGMFQLDEISALAASVEDLLELVRSGQLELDARTLDLVVEAFDELAILLQQARGDQVPSAWLEVRSKLDRLTQDSSRNPSRADAGDPGDLGSGLPSDLELILSSEEVAAVTRHLEQGRRVCRISLEFDPAGPSGHEETVLRYLQEKGEILSVLPPGDKSGGCGKRVISLIYTPTQGEVDLGNLEDGCGVTVSYLKGQPSDAGVKPESSSQGGSSTGSGISPDRSSGVGTLSVKVDIGVLDGMMNMVSELYSVRLGLLGLAKRLPHTDETRRLRDDLLKISLILNNRVSALEESIAGVRLVPVSFLFDRYTGEVRRLARKSNKKVSLEFEGEATLIDRAMLDNLHDPLLHIIRNAIDHGIESPDERLAQSKPEIGRILLRARHEASHICIEVADDGRGVDCAKVKRKAMEKGISMAGTVSPLSLIFEPGMSTSGGVSDISGRGVGLDAAKTRVESLKGMITAESTPGHGARFSVYVPLTLAVSRGVLVEENGLPSVIPLRSVIEVIRLAKDSVLEMKRSGMLVHRGQRVKALVLSEMLGAGDRRNARSAVILGIGDKRRALVAQEVKGETEVVCRPLPEAMIAPGFIAGATELNDGRAAIIIEPEDLLRETPGVWAGGSETPYRLSAVPGSGNGKPRKSVHTLIFRSGGYIYGVSLELLREVISLKHISEVPVLGDSWHGIFFNRGMCHGLMRLWDSGAPTSQIQNAAILGYPERCGIGVDEILGNFRIPVSDMQLSSDQGRAGLLQPYGKFTWRDQDVTVLGVGTPDIGKGPNSPG